MLDVQSSSLSAIIHRSEDLAYSSEVASSPPLRRGFQSGVRSFGRSGALHCETKSLQSLYVIFFTTPQGSDITLMDCRRRTASDPPVRRSASVSAPHIGNSPRQSLDPGWSLHHRLGKAIQTHAPAGQNPDTSSLDSDALIVGRADLRPHESPFFV